MNDPKESNTNPSFILGILIGAALTYLFTNKQGQKIRDELLKEGTKLLEKIGQEAEHAKDIIEEKSPQIQKQISQNTEAVKTQIKEIAGEAGQIIQEVPEKVEEIQKKGRKFFFKKHSGES
jgi:gas vesicle protein